ncbi:MAG: hypothetical protein F6K15_01120 [Okeania sp. SIO2B3]|nr:hypothetical protein [Okeania sp. SIO2B3]
MNILARIVDLLFGNRIVCPRCGSTDIENETHCNYYCNECGYYWPRMW